MANQGPRMVGYPRLAASGPPSNVVKAGERFLVVVATDRLHAAEGNTCTLTAIDGPTTPGQMRQDQGQRVAVANMFPEQGYSTYHFVIRFDLEPGVLAALRKEGPPDGRRPFLVGPYTLSFEVTCKEPHHNVWHSSRVSIDVYKEIDVGVLRMTSAWERYITGRRTLQ
ncbi:hypothetical protein NLU13_8875 [Sarocladium strictum]|uniref:Uncharacterized protein n=1 Tax=Sarocladium strictum TaxID=5046 RepID=A0AA39GAH6_SARSR|nr:hypothetical protein NLU13_8875 [Sarocladium strictum]